MINSQDRYTYLDNIMNFLIINVVFFHIICMFAYPLGFGMPVIEKTSTSRIYEILVNTMDTYLMPHVIFISALFIFPSWNAKSTKEYIKKRFFRLVMPVVAFLFIAGDTPHQILLKRFDNSVSYLAVFLEYWKDFIGNFSIISYVYHKKMLSDVNFTMSHIWFLSFLFSITLLVILAAFPFRKKIKVKIEICSRKKIITKIIIFAILFGFIGAGIALFFVFKNIDFRSWVSVLGLIHFKIDQFWILLPLFLSGLYVYRKGWLMGGDIGSWKTWGILSAVIIIYSIFLQSRVFPVTEKILKVTEYNSIFQDKIPYPTVPGFIKYTYLLSSFNRTLICIFLLMFFLSFTKKYFNKPNKITEFCSKHSINIYILHYIPVLFLQYTLVNLPIAPILKSILILIVVIPGCLWLSHRLIFPHPVIAISFFALLKVISLFAGFNFFYIALMGVIVFSFTGAVIESARLLISVKYAK